MEAVEKKKLWVFIAIAYGVVILMAPFMVIGLKKEMDLTLFVNAQMFFPACGVMLGKMIFRKEDEKLPIPGYVAFLAITALMLFIAILYVFVGGGTIELLGQQIDLWQTAASSIITLGSIVVYVLFWVCGREQRQNAGLCRVNLLKSVLMIVLFVILYLLRDVIVSVLSDKLNATSESMDMLKAALTNPKTLILLVVLAPNFFLTFTAFFGEEYGWRYYLQPLLQKRFGKRVGILILGLVWALWHWDADFMFYTTTTGIQMFLSQVVTCLAIGIFFGWAYMKTQNIWVPVIMHYLNNNLIAVLAGGDTSVLQNQQVSWSDIPIHLISCLVYIVFIFLPAYSERKKESETVE